MIAKFVRSRASSLAVSVFAWTIAAFGASAAANASTIYFLQNNTDIGIYDTGSNTLSPLATVAGAGLATGPLQNLTETPDGMLYFIDAAEELWRFNPATPGLPPVDIGKTALAAPSSRLTADALGRLITATTAFDELIYISPLTAATTSTVALTQAPGGIAGGDMAVAQSGEIYAVSGSNVFEFSPLGGAITTLTANAGFSPLTALAFDPQTGALYGSVGGGPPTDFLTINQTTGVASLTNTITTGGTANDFASLPTYPDLLVTKSHAGTFLTGTTNTYTIGVKNAGTFPTSGTITVTDTLPAGLTYDAATTSGTGWTCAEATAPNVVCTSTASIPAGASGNAITLGVRVVGPAGTVTNSVSATGGGQPVVLPTTIANDSTTISGNGALSIVKTAPATAALNGLIAYSILVTNTGTVAADGAAFSDTVPANLVIAGAPACVVTSGAATCATPAVTGQTVTDTITAFPVNASVTISINVKPTVSASYTNTATITPPAASGETAASSSATTVVSATSGFTKTVRNVTTGGTAGTDSTGSPGDVLEYVLTFTNTTGATLTNFVVNDPVPAHTTFVSAACGTLPAGVTGCTVANPAAGGTGNVSFTYAGALANGASGTFVLDVKIQ